MSLSGPSGGSGNGRDLPVNAEINVTSLIDVAFTLLVIFIITAPVLQGGLEVDVPRGDVQAVTARDDPFFVTVMDDGSIYVAETRVERENFRETFEQLVQVAQPEMVYVRGDSLALYGAMGPVIADVWQVAHQEGFRSALVMEEDIRRR